MASMHGSFGELLRKSRRGAGLTLTELSAQCGLDAPYLSRIERGERPAPETVPYVLRICDALELKAGSKEFLKLVRSAALERTNAGPKEIDQMIRQLTHTAPAVREESPRREFRRNPHHICTRDQLPNAYDYMTEWLNRGGEVVEECEMRFRCRSGKTLILDIEAPQEQKVQEVRRRIVTVGKE